MVDSLSTNPRRCNKYKRKVNKHRQTFIRNPCQMGFCAFLIQGDGIYIRLDCVATSLTDGIHDHTSQAFTLCNINLKLL